MNKSYVVVGFSMGIVVLIALFGGMAIYHKKSVLPTTTPVVQTSMPTQQGISSLTDSKVKDGSSTENMVVKDKKNCEETPLTLGTSSDDSYLSFLYSGCGNDYGFHSWFFNDGIHKYVFALVYDDVDSKCGCSSTIGYFDYNKVYKENSSLYLKRSDIILFKDIYKGVSNDQSYPSYTFNNMRYVVNLVEFPTTTLYFVDPISKKTFKGNTVYHNLAQTFCGSEMDCSAKISFSSSSKSISVDVYTYATVTEMFMNEPKIETRIIPLPH